MYRYSARTQHQFTWLSPALTFLLRWGWFLCLSVLLMGIATLLLPDSASADSYQATLLVQVPLPGDLNTVQNQNASASMYAYFLVTPGVLSLVLPKHKELQLSDLESLISTNPIPDTNSIQLSALADTPAHASVLVTDIYTAFLSAMQTQRATILNQEISALNSELQNVQADAASSNGLLQTLYAAHQSGSSEYQQVSSLYARQLQQISAINQQVLALQTQLGIGGDPVQLSSLQPMLTTIPGANASRDQRLALVPLAGLLMGLGGALLADRFSSRLPLHGKRRELILPWIHTMVPFLPRLGDRRLVVIKQTAACLSLFRQLRYQSHEQKRPLQVITVTSPGSREGKTVVALNLALAAAQYGLQTILVDANPQHPELHSWFRLSNTVGTLDAERLLDGHTDAHLSPVVATREQNLKLVPIGSRSTSQVPLAEALRLNVLRPFTTLLSEQADLVIYDGPPLLDDANAPNLVQVSDITILVVDARKSRVSAITAARNLLTRLEASSILVLNRASPYDNL